MLHSMFLIIFLILLLLNSIHSTKRIILHDSNIHILSIFISYNIHKTLFHIHCVKYFDRSYKNLVQHFQIQFFFNFEKKITIIYRDEVITDFWLYFDLEMSNIYGM